MSIKDKYLKLKRQLFPTGRAFRLYSDGNSERLFKALAIQEAQTFNDIKSTLFSLIPDNINFDEDDATDWERRLGLISNPLVSLEDRKLAIYRKMASPGVNPARSGAKWLEKQLQDAGFNVYVYENIFPDYPSGYERYTPGEINNNILSDCNHGMFNHGGFRHGSFYNYIVANSIYNSEDIKKFNNITDFACSFFICGSTIGTYATVLETREAEFRQLILSQKQVQDIAFCYVNFI